MGKKKAPSSAAPAPAVLASLPPVYFSLSSASSAPFPSLSQRLRLSLSPGNRPPLQPQNKPHFRPHIHTISPIQLCVKVNFSE
nr:MAG TPA: hypothetical protein [Caudoviricetes sp.]